MWNVKFNQKYFLNCLFKQRIMNKQKKLLLKIIQAFDLPV